MDPGTTIVDELRRVPLFARCTTDELAALAAVLDRRVIEAGTVLVAEGELTPALVVVVDGVAEVTRDGAHVVDVTAGEFVGELAVIDGPPATATVTASTAMTLLVIDREHASRLLAHEDVAAQLLRRVVHWMRTTPASDEAPRPSQARRTRRTRSVGATGWDSITVAEQRVVDLVVAGQSNQEVAEVLFISRHTVESHLKSVYAKLGLSSRTELAVEALRRRA